MATVVPTLSTLATHKPGEGLCVFFWDSDYEFFPGGIGSALGYSNYKGPVAFNTSVSAAINGVKGAYAGIGFDVAGNFSKTVDGKVGTMIKTNMTSTLASSVTSVALTGNPNSNTVCVRMGHLSGYAVHSVSPNLSTFPLTSQPNHESYINSPPVTLHQYVSSREDVTFNSFRVALQNEGRTIRVDVKSPTDGKYYPYHITELPYGLNDSKYPVTIARVGLSFATSDKTANCEIKNFAVYGNIKEYEKGADKRKKIIDRYTRIEPLTATRFETVYKPDGLA